MATLESDEANIFDAETVNWQVVVIPILLAVLVVLGGLAYYYYQQNQRDQLEDNARAALVAAKTPEEFLKVADQYPGADQATLALFSAANASFNKRDFAGAMSSYQRILSGNGGNSELRDSAELGLASAQEAAGKADDAIASYLVVANEGAKSPFAPYAFNSVALIYDQRGDKDNERKTLTQAAALDPDSPFVKQAQFKLKELTTPPMTVPVPASAAPAPTMTPVTAPAAPAPAKPAAK
jgi:predicted negative regulator of RcsB-dependent stress response